MKRQLAGDRESSRRLIGCVSPVSIRGSTFGARSAAFAGKSRRSLAKLPSHDPGDLPASLLPAWVSARSRGVMVSDGEAQPRRAFEDRRDLAHPMYRVPLSKCRTPRSPIYLCFWLSTLELRGPSRPTPQARFVRLPSSHLLIPGRLGSRT